MDWRDSIAWNALALHMAVQDYIPWHPIELPIISQLLSLSTAKCGTKTKKKDI